MSKVQSDDSITNIVGPAMDDICALIEDWLQTKALELSKLDIKYYKEYKNIIRYEVILQFINMPIRFRASHLLTEYKDNLATLLWTATEYDGISNIGRLSHPYVNDPPCSGVVMFYDKKDTLLKLYQYYNDLDKYGVV